MRPVLVPVVRPAVIAAFSLTAAGPAFGCIHFDDIIIIDGYPYPTWMQWFGPEHVGSEFTFDIVIEDTDPLITWQCLLYTLDSANVADESFEFASPEGWQNNFSIAPPWSPPEPDGPPYGRRYYVESVDFSFSNPLAIPATIGTFRFRCVAAGPVTFVIDVTESAYYTASGFSSDFNGPDANCPTIGVAHESWGSVKKLFR